MIPQRNSAVIFMVVAIQLSCSKPNSLPVVPLTPIELSQAIGDAWDVTWEPSVYYDADVVAKVENKFVDVCIRFSCDTSSGYRLVEQITSNFSTQVIERTETINAENKLQIGYVRESIQQNGMPHWNVARSTHFAFDGNKLLSWHVSEDSISIYLLCKAIDRGVPSVAALMTTASRPSPNHGVVIPPRQVQFERHGISEK